MSSFNAFKFVGWMSPLVRQHQRSVARSAAAAAASCFFSPTRCHSTGTNSRGRTIVRDPRKKSTPRPQPPAVPRNHLQEQQQQLQHQQQQQQQVFPPPAPPQGFGTMLKEAFVYGIGISLAFIVVRVLFGI